MKTYTTPTIQNLNGSSEPVPNAAAFPVAIAVWTVAAILTYVAYVTLAYKAVGITPES